MGRALTGLRLLTSAIIVLILIYATLPHDNTARLSIRFNAQKLAAFLTGPLRNDRWLYEDPAFPVNWSRDVAIVLKTGFGTQERATAWLEALPVGISPESVIIVGDFESRLVAKVQDSHQMAFDIHNVVADVVQDYGQTSPRGAKYRTLASTVVAGEYDLARNLSSSFGWELDAIKVGIEMSPREIVPLTLGQFIPALQLAFQAAPKKKWYVLVDDDTYLIQPSLDIVLGHYDTSEPHYLGNAVGDYRQRFAHGGSSIAISYAALTKLFATRNAPALAAARVASLKEVWGDRLLAAALLKVGVHIEEQASRFFNGEPPRAARLRDRRFCVPVATYHHLSTDEMREAAGLFRRAVDPVLWIDLWDLYGAPPFETYRGQPLREAWDHVGRLDEHTRTLTGAKTALGCSKFCEAHEQCLAWTWDENEALCHLSPWVVVGTESRGRVSGLHVDRVRHSADLCR